MKRLRNPIPSDHPVSEILTDLLDTVLTSCLSKPQTYSSFQNSNRQITSDPELALSPNMNTIIDLDIDSDSQQPPLPSTQEDDDNIAVIPISSKTSQPPVINDDDDDDGIEIVSTAIINPPSSTNPIHAPIIVDDSDTEPTPNPTTNSNSIQPLWSTSLPDTKPNPVSVDNIPSSPEVDVIECTTTQPQQKPQQTSQPINMTIRTPRKCHACFIRMLRPHPPLVRCKHTLCASCSVRAVTDPLPSAEKDSTHFVAGTLKRLPICPVSRCGAPLRATEAELALVPDSVDDAFTSAYTEFKQWMMKAPTSDDDEDEHFGAHAIHFPQYDETVEKDKEKEAEPSQQQSGQLNLPPLPPIQNLFGVIDMFHHTQMSLAVAAASLPQVGSGDANEVEKLQPQDMEVLNDDLSSAFAPLWLWEEDVNAGVAGIWVCAACGQAESPLQMGARQKRIKEASRANENPEEITSGEGEGNAVVPDSPTYPHCAYARAIGVVENINGLAKMKEDAEKKTGKKRVRTGVKRKQPSRSASNPSKRYKSASSVRRAQHKGTGFAKGTAFGGKHGPEWQGNTKQQLEKKVLRDRMTAYWLSRIRSFLVLNNKMDRTSWPGFMRLMLREHNLVQHLSAVLINESIMDVQERVPVFMSALRIVHIVAESPSLRTLVTDPVDGDKGRSIAELVESLSTQAAFLTSGVDGNLSQLTSTLVKQIRKCIRVVNRHDLIRIAREKQKARVIVNVDNLESDSAMENNAVSNDAANPQGEHNQNGEEKENSSEKVSEEEKTAYIEQMRPFQFKTVPNLASISTFASEANSPSHSLPGRQRRIAGEVASLFSSLPLNWSSTILVRVDEDRYDILQACIFGPEDTPYDSGAFIFDIYLPPQYPEVPPKFRLLTTGAGKIRFNPNLYASGKVCLSLLGTWSGPSWTKASTILQVLVSIQSLILVPDPYFNEPGFEKQMGTPQGAKFSGQYNAKVRMNNAFYAIQSNIKNVPGHFKEGIYTHFRLKRRYLLTMLPKWFPNTGEQGEDCRPGSAQTHNGQGVGVSIDPTLQPLGYSMFPPLSSFGYQMNGSPSEFQMLSFEPGRNFRSPQMSLSNLNSILETLNSIATT